MSDLFKTDDVLYRIPGKSNDEDPIRRVRGVYVSGPYLPIIHENNMILISEIKCDKPTIVNYTQREDCTTMDHNNVGVFAIRDIDLNNQPEVIFYKKTNKICNINDPNNIADGVFSICDIDLNNNPEIIPYETTFESRYICPPNTEGVFAICDIDINTEIAYEDYYKFERFFGHNDLIMIRNVITRHATISN